MKVQCLLHGFKFLPDHSGGFWQSLWLVLLSFSEPFLQVAHAHLNKGARPLGRTKSAPLPLGHPMLQGSHPSSLQMPTANYQEYLQEKQLYDQQQQQHNLLKQHIRKTVLTRASSRNTSAQLEEAVEVDDSAEVILLFKSVATKIIVLNSSFN